jgi:D-alanyl-D-alanine carboxypeptidase
MLELLKDFFEKNINNNYIWLFIIVIYFLISKLEIDNKNDKLKISIIYLLMFSLSIFNNDFHTIYLIIFTIIILFIYLEFIYLDSFTRKFIKKVRYMILDFLYKLIFEYYFLYFLLSMLLVSKHNFFITVIFIIYLLFITLKVYKKQFKKSYLLFLSLFLLTYINNSFILLLSITILLIGIIKTYNNEFEASSYEEIYKKMEKVLPIAKFKNNSKLIDFFDILISREDKSYFQRKNSYNWLNYEFIKYRLNRCNFKNLDFKNKLKFLYKSFLKVYQKVIYIIKMIIINSDKIRHFVRGYSTIEMQLIRTLSIKNGYSRYLYRRKIYEFIYSTIFFNSLKEYFKYYHFPNINVFKYYLIYIYINVAPVTINGKKYNSIYNLFNKNNLEEIEKEEFYIWVLGLSNHPINLDILKNLPTKEINWDKLYHLILKINYLKLDDEEKYSKVLNEIKNNEYYIKKYENDYLIYYKDHSSESLDEIVGIVNVRNIKQSSEKNIEFPYVNKKISISNDYIPSNLVDVYKTYSNRNVKINEKAYICFKNLHRAAEKENINILISSGYRNYNEQLKIVNLNLIEHDSKWVDIYMAQPGHSEHQTGLAIDVDISTDSEDPSSGFDWLEANAYKYGFILRYPRNKEKITGYNYEPWHYRYVGKEIAKEIYESDITLDEYYAYYIQK